MLFEDAMKWNFKWAAIALLTVFTITPAQAITTAEQAEVWRWQLERAYCAENWTEAISVAGALMGSDIQPSERLWLFGLRQEMFNYQRGTASFSGCGRENSEVEVIVSR
ncbi:MAG: hypothetical protein Kow00121_56340 [Elainellaceae cyanobacterium]